MLYEQNWGGVWQGQEWFYPQTIAPNWIRLPRLILKVLHLPLGRKAWHRFEQRFLGYWMSNLCGYSIMPYWDVIRDSRGYRNGMAFYAAHYLAARGMEYGGKPQQRD